MLILAAGALKSFENNDENINGLQLSMEIKIIKMIVIYIGNNAFKRASHGWTSSFYASKNNNYQVVEISRKRKDLDIDLFMFHDRKRKIAESVIKLSMFDTVIKMFTSK